MDKLELFHAVARVAKPVHLTYTPIASLETPFKEANIDSLDILLISVYFCELYGIDEHIAKTLLPATPQEIFDFLDKHKTREPSSIEESVRLIK